MQILWSIGNKVSKTIIKNLEASVAGDQIADHIRNGGSETDWSVWKPGWTAWKTLAEAEEIHEIVKAKISPVQDPTEPPPFEVEEAPPLFAEETSLPDTIVVPSLQSLAKPPPPILKLDLNTDKPEPIIHTPEMVGKVTPQLPTQIPAQNPEGKVVLFEDDIKIIHADKAESNKSESERRRSPRIKMRLRCIIRSTHLTFRTFTSDVSLSGVALESEIPSDFLGEDCQINILSPNQDSNLRFRIKMASRPISKYFSFENADPEFIKHLKVWLKSPIKSSKKTA